MHHTTTKSHCCFRNVGNNLNMEEDETKNTNGGGSGVQWVVEN